MTGMKRFKALPLILLLFLSLAVFAQEQTDLVLDIKQARGNIDAVLDSAVAVDQSMSDCPDLLYPEGYSCDAGQINYGIELQLYNLDLQMRSGDPAGAAQRAEELQAVITQSAETIGLTAAQASAVNDSLSSIATNLTSISTGVPAGEEVTPGLYTLTLPAGLGGISLRVNGGALPVPGNDIDGLVRQLNNGTLSPSNMEMTYDGLGGPMDVSWIGEWPIDESVDLTVQNTLPGPNPPAIAQVYAFDGSGQATGLAASLDVPALAPEESHSQSLDLSGAGEGFFAVVCEACLPPQASLGKVFTPPPTIVIDIPLPSPPPPPANNPLPPTSLCPAGSDCSTSITNGTFTIRDEEGRLTIVNNDSRLLFGYARTLDEIENASLRFAAGEVGGLRFTAADVRGVRFISNFDDLANLKVEAFNDRLATDVGIAGMSYAFGRFTGQSFTIGGGVVPDFSDDLEQRCQTSLDCPPQFICVNGICKLSSLLSEQECQSNKDCPYGYLCVNNVCERTGVPMLPQE